VKPSAILPRESGQPVDDHRCIHCYCCHEFCPSQAIDLRVPRMARFLHLHALANGASRLLGILAARSKRRLSG
jgi:Fe-S-cluster-containing hydrogenase component 2